MTVSMQVTTADPSDCPPWLDLAREVEPLFGPMVADPDFHATLERDLARGSAVCVREAAGPPGSPLLAGMLWTADPPRYHIGWLAVAERARRQGIGRRLLDHLLARVSIPSTVRLTTFAPGVRGGEAARRLYARVGFRPEGPAPVNPAGLPCEVLALPITRHSTARAVIQSGKHYLLAQHHYINPANHGKWSLLGGGMEPTERDPETTVRRELAEELQAEIEVIRPLHVYTHEERLHHVFVAQLDCTGPLRADPQEVATLGWFTFAGVEALQRSGALFAPFVFDAIRDSRNGPSVR